MSNDKKNRQVPEGFRRVSDDPIGFFDPNVQSAIRFRPRGVSLCDNSLKAGTVTILIIGEATARVSLSEGVVAEPGDTIGIWYRPGMKDVHRTFGAEVYLVSTGEEIDVGKPCPMKVFEVYATGAGTLLPILHDYRDNSRACPTPFDTGEPIGSSGKVKSKTGNSADEYFDN